MTSFEGQTDAQVTFYSIMCLTLAWNKKYE